jgi:prefoldin subunit 5
MTRIKSEKESLERENDQLKEALEAERKGMRKYLNQMHQRNKHVENLEEQVIC